MADNYWQDIDGDVNNVANWSLGAVPVITNNVFIVDGNNNVANSKTAVNEKSLVPMSMSFPA